MCENIKVSKYLINYKIFFVKTGSFFLRRNLRPQCCAYDKCVQQLSRPPHVCSLNVSRPWIHVSFYSHVCTRITERCERYNAHMLHAHTRNSMGLMGGKFAGVDRAAVKRVRAELFKINVHMFIV